MTTLKIGIDSTPLLGQRSGVGHYTSRLLRSLMQTTNWEYLLYSNRPLQPLPHPLNTATQSRQYFPTSRWVWMQTILPSIIRRSQPALCHFTNALAPLWQPQPYVLTIHDASLFTHSQYHPRARRLTMKTLLPIVARRASALITVSQHAQQDIAQALNIPPEKIHVIYEASAEHFQPITNPAELQRVRRTHNLPQQFILYVGTIEPRKNLHRLLRAFHNARRAGYPHHLVLAGPRGWMMDDFEQEIESLGLNNVVHYLGYVPTNDLPSLFSLATLFAFPSLYEGFGLPPLEAMACGTPVLTSNRSSLAEICGDAAHLINPECEDCLTRGLTDLLDDADYRHSLSQRGLARAQTFSWERTARETAQVYNQVIAAK